MLNKYLEVYVVVEGTMLEIVATRLFNTFMGKRNPVFSSLDNAVELIKK